MPLRFHTVPLLAGQPLSGSCLTYPLLPPCSVKHDPLSALRTRRNAWVRMATLAEVGPPFLASSSIGTVW